jgi:hypothetical protein
MVYVIFRLDKAIRRVSLERIPAVPTEEKSFTLPHPMPKLGM